MHIIVKNTTIKVFRRLSGRAHRAMLPFSSHDKSGRSEIGPYDGRLSGIKRLGRIEIPESPLTVVRFRSRLCCRGSSSLWIEARRVLGRQQPSLWIV